MKPIIAQAPEIDETTADLREEWMLDIKYFKNSLKVVFCGIFVSCSALPVANSSPPLEYLRAAAEKADTSALVVLKGKDVLGEWYFDGPSRVIETQSITKAITSLLLGTLIGTEAIPSLDVPVANYYPEWNQGRKKTVSIRHIMHHTSCLQDVQSSSEEIAQAPDAVQLALAAELICDPGTQYGYSNKAPNLLAGIVKKSTGKALDELAAEVLFEPLGIDEYYWHKDQHGNPYAMGGLLLKPRDLAKIGQLIANRGKWNGRQMIPEAWVAVLGEPHGPGPANHGLFWWRPPHNFSKDVLVARGWRGQYLWINMATGLVAVRVYDIARGTDRSVVDFARFEELAESLG